MKLTKITALVLALALLGGAPSVALAGKKKGPKPYKSETVTIEFGHAAFWGASGTLLTITSQEFLQTCSIPSSNGVDAYVFEVPADYQKIQSTIEVKGTTSSPTGYDLDIYLFDDACASTGFFNSTNPDEVGVVASGTAFILIHSFGNGGLPAGGGGPVDAQFTLAPYKG